MSHLQVDLVRELTGSAPCGEMPVGDDVWSMYVVGASRIGRDWYMQLALVGPQFCTVTARVGGPIDHSETARRVVQLVRRWLAEDDRGTHGFVDASLPTPTGLPV